MSSPKFINTLYLLINETNNDIISWSKDGTYVVVKDIKKFEKNILSKYFRHNNIKSLQRQLNYYGFKKIKSKLYFGFEHNYFQKNQMELLKKIQRKHNIITKKRKIENKNENKENFDDMSKQVFYNINKDILMEDLNYIFLDEDNLE